MRIQSYGTLATSFKTTLPIILNPTSSIAPMRPSSRGRCRSCCEYPSILAKILWWKPHGWSEPVLLSGPATPPSKRAWSKSKAAVSVEACPWSPSSSSPCRESPGCRCCWTSVYLFFCTCITTRASQLLRKVTFTKYISCPRPLRRPYARKQRTKQPSTLLRCGRCTPWAR